MTDPEFDAMLRSALLEAARRDAEALTADASGEAPRSLQNQAEMAALLRDPGPCESKPKRRPSLWRRSRLFRSVACLALVAALGLGGALSFSPDARAWVVRFFAERFDDHSAFSFQGDADMEDAFYRPAYIPAGYMEQEGQDLPDDWVTYVNDQGKFLYFTYMSGNMAGTIAVDNEHSTERVITISGGIEAHLLETISSEYPSFLIWMDEDQGAAFMLNGYVSSEELIRMAESVEAE